MQGGRRCRRCRRCTSPKGGGEHPAELGPEEAVDEEVGGGVDEGEVADGEVCEPLEVRHVVGPARAQAGEDGRHPGGVVHCGPGGGC